MEEIWQEFVALLKRGPFPAEKVRPYQPAIKAFLLEWLDARRDQANWEEWAAPSEVHRVGNQVHFLLPLTFKDQQSTYCFSFVVEEHTWYFQHVESITLRLNQVGPLPATVFPDVTESQKAWIREELRVSEQITFFNRLVEQQGKMAASEWFKDGAGYMLSAKAWVPFVRPERAFILYLCWEQANLRGNGVTLRKLDDQEAWVELAPMYFRLYHQSAHLRQLITWEDYGHLFELIWQDRSRHAGWKLEITYQDSAGVIFHFTR